MFSGHFVGVAAKPDLAAAAAALGGVDASYLAQQITRMESAVYNDADLAIGTAKELIETCCRTILEARGESVPANQKVTQVVKRTAKVLSLAPDDIPDRAKAVDTIRRLLANLAAIGQGIAELRNHYGTGHGKPAAVRGLETRHAKLAVGAASTLVMFLAETHQRRLSGDTNDSTSPPG